MADILTTKSFWDLRSAKDKRVVVLEGGARSGKTWSIAQYLAEICLTAKSPLRLVIARDYLVNLRKILLPDIKKAWTALGIWQESHLNKSDNIYTLNGCEIYFTGLLEADGAEKIHGFALDYVWVNEAQAIPFAPIEQFLMRLETQLLADFNPNCSGTHWLYEKIRRRPDHAWFHSTINDNPFAPKGVINEIMAFEPTPENYARGTADPTMWNIYGLGKRDVVRGLVFPEFEVVEEIPGEALNWCGGMDFGFCVSDDTEALTKKGWKKRVELSLEDELLTLDPATGLSEWQKPLSINVFTGDFKMEEFNKRGHSSLTTSNHRWPVLRNDKEIKIYMTTTRKINGSEGIIGARRCVNLPKGPTYTDNFVELVAWFWTEGQIHAGGVSLWQNEGPYADRMRRCLEKEYGPALINTRNGKHRAPGGWVERPKRIRVKDHEQCHFAINLNGRDRLLAVAPGKVVTAEFISSLTEAQVRIFVETSIDGDGCRDVLHKGATITQSSIDRLHPMQMACSLLGIKTTLMPFTTNGFPGWRLRLYGGKKCSYITPGDRKKITYTGAVWCPTTPNGTWYARRNGMVYFTGNSVDPSALLLKAELGSSLYLKELTYARGLASIHNSSNPDRMSIEGELIRNKFPRNIPIYADSEDPRIISDLKSKGWWVEGAIKGQGSVDYSIEVMKRYKIKLVRGGMNLLKEFEGFKWALDRDGNPTGKPVKGHDHLISAARYASSMSCGRQAYRTGKFEGARMAREYIVTEDDDWNDSSGSASAFNFGGGSPFR